MKTLIFLQFEHYFEFSHIAWFFNISDHSPLSHTVVRNVCWALIDDGPALRMSSPRTPSSPAAFPNVICFIASSTSLTSGAFLVNGALVTGG